MKKSTFLRVIGAFIVLLLLIFVGRLSLRGISVFALLFGFAVGYEYLVVRPASSKERRRRRKNPLID